MRTNCLNEFRTFGALFYEHNSTINHTPPTAYNATEHRALPEADQIPVLCSQTEKEKKKKEKKKKKVS